MVLGAWGLSLDNRTRRKSNFSRTAIKESVEYGDMLEVTGVVVLLGTSEGRLVEVFGSRPVWYKSTDLTSKED